MESRVLASLKPLCVLWLQTAETSLLLDYHRHQYNAIDQVKQLKPSLVAEELSMKLLFIKL